MKRREELRVDKAKPNRRRRRNCFLPLFFHSEQNEDTKERVTEEENSLRDCVSMCRKHGKKRVRNDVKKRCDLKLL